MSFAWLKEADREFVVGYFVERFGISPETFEGVDLFERGEFVNAVAAGVRAVSEVLDAEDAGIALARKSRSGMLKPATRGVQAFCTAATENVVDITREELRAIVEGRAVELEGMKGFVLLRLEGEIAGVGLAREGRLISQLPRNFTQHLSFR